MHIVYQAEESRMQGRVGPNAVFRLYFTSASATPELTLSGAEIIRIIQAHIAQTHLVLELADKIATLPERRDLYARRRLVGQHRRLKTLPTSPHAPSS